MSEINFAVWAPDQATFWASWQVAGIVVMNAETGRYEYTPEYRDHIEVRDWGSGTIPDKPGWFANVRVTGSLVPEFTYGLEQTDENGHLLPIWDRTWATMVFDLTYRDADLVTGFPAGYRNNTGVCYSDMRDIATPYEVRQ